MKALLTLLALWFTFPAVAQDRATWLGGTFGRENAWETASNWSTNQVPDEETAVTVPFRNSGHQAQPVIKSDAFAASLVVEAQASVTVTKQGSLTVGEEFAETFGVKLLGGEFNNSGSVYLVDIAAKPSAELAATLKDEGELFLQTGLLTRK